MASRLLPGLGWCFVLWTVGMVLANKLEIIRQQRVQRAVAALLERAIVSIHWLVEVRACISNMYSRWKLSQVDGQFLVPRVLRFLSTLTDAHVSLLLDPVLVVNQSWLLAQVRQASNVMSWVPCWFPEHSFSFGTTNRQLPLSCNPADSYKNTWPRDWLRLQFGNGLRPFC